MFEIAAQDGRAVKIPFDADEDRPYFSGMDEAALGYYFENGYVVLRDLIDEGKCKSATRHWAQEVKPYRGPIYRQTTSNPERHHLNALGHIMNPVQNIQDLRDSHFSGLRLTALNIFTDLELCRALRAIFNDQPKLVQSMYFEGNSATWAHQDTYYLDSERLGTMCGVWFALEDIHPGAGRFFVYPGSHKIDLFSNSPEFNVAFNHAKYKELIIATIKKTGLEVHAPALRRGDILIWNSKTIHGSLETKDTENTRQSLTAHYIPHSDRFFQFQTVEKKLHCFEHNGIAINSPKSQNKLKNRLIMYVEVTFPRSFRLAKQIAIKLMTR